MNREPVRDAARGMENARTVFWLEESAGLGDAGGKGYNLMQLSRAGFPVPPGFVVSSSAYAKFVRLNRLDGMLEQAGSARSDETREQLARAIRKGFENGRFPPDVEREIGEAYARLCNETGNGSLPVAVRSSAIGEDQAEASWAGQMDTYLNVRGGDAVLDAVRRCFGSLWSERAAEYRSRAKDGAQTAMAVVVQRMVFADAAGVLFTSNPLSGDRGQIVIDAVWGLGEAMVGGVAVPDHILFDKEKREISAYDIAEKRVMTVPAGSGTEEKPVPGRLRKKRVLNPAQIALLAKHAETSEKLFGCPQDMEWCVDGGGVFVVQSRPITTMPEKPVCWEAPGKGKWLHGGGKFEMITEPLSPLFESLMLPEFTKAVGELLDEAGVKDVLPGDLYEVINGYLYQHVRFHIRPWRWHYGRLFGAAASILRPSEGLGEQQRRYREAVGLFSAKDAKSLGDGELLDGMAALAALAMRNWWKLSLIVSTSYIKEKKFAALCKKVFGEEGASPEVFLLGQDNKAFRAECSIYDLAKLAERLGLAGRIDETPFGPGGGDAAALQWREALRVHLECHGSQLSSVDPAKPTLSFDPRPVLSAVRAFAGGREAPQARRERMERESDAAVEKAEARLSSGNRGKFRKLLEETRRSACFREDSLFDFGLAFTPLRGYALEFGKRLADRGVLEKPEDVFFLRMEELESAAESSVFTGKLRDAVRERLENKKLWGRVAPPYLLPVGSRAGIWRRATQIPEVQGSSNADSLSGFGVSPGKVTAVARVIKSLDDSTLLNDGEILVTRSTTPAWTPLFSRAAGLVTDLGGPLSHGSIVAREVGIPAVMGAGNATRRIKDGQKITVLGGEGKVLLR